MTRFLLISLLSVFFFSCKSYQVKDAVKTERDVKEYKNHYFSNPETDYVYKAHIEVYGNQLSGIFVAKRVNDATHRVVFATDFGNTLLDFELSETDFKVNYIVEDLNRKLIVNTLRDDFRLLLRTNHPVQQIFENQDALIYQSQDENRLNYFFESKTDKKLLKIVRASKTKEKVVFEFGAKNSTFAENIQIQHYNIKLKIALTQITN